MRAHTIGFGIAFLLLMCTCQVLAQTKPESEVSPMIMRMIGGKASAGGGNVTYDNGTGYGIVCGQMVETHVFIEGSYTFFPTQGHFNPPPGSILPPTTKDMTIHYLQFGASYHAMTENIQPYVSTGWGAVWFRPSNTPVKGDWRLFISGSFGVKVFPNPLIGIRFEARVLAPVYLYRGGFWSEIEGGNANFRAGFPIIQADFAAGLTFAF